MTPERKEDDEMLSVANWEQLIAAGREIGRIEGCESVSDDQLRQTISEVLEKKGFFRSLRCA